MRTSLIIFGVIFLVVGVLLYYMPIQEIKADTTTMGTGESLDVRTSSARVTVPVEWAAASAIIGFVLLMLGLVIPDRSIRSDSKEDSYEKVVESKENTEVGDGNKSKVVTERTEKSKSR